ncbi:FtsK/SpoIIIE domain-containing protein [Lentzea albida]|uniref:DNA segregation ATPase FtsK/SpoIIIE, S-DNA-T family n=1 Tax=Lentzea albida TaxID=65499 RepID=A0A1H9I2T6_9PSEU|nr:FtsK/SpoIIIE domain-containing protein [Lentzea albida]SEQ68981.1 DNA segregation ATPase FtsK/SpoIIIE, S-DNA-T family [Lentzea albida]
MGWKWNASKRVVAAEFRAARWLARNPEWMLAPSAVAAGACTLGPTTTGYVLGGAAGATGLWYRGHPDSFDTLAAPVLRAWQRRWFGAYSGGRWRDLMDVHKLTTEHRRKKVTNYPRVVRVRSYSPSIDTVLVKLAKGQSPMHFARQAEELAHAIEAERIAIELVKPGYVALVVQRDEPFTDIIPAPDMPEHSEDVDLRAVLLGEDEYGGDWTEPVQGTHTLTAGGTGSGKNSLAFAKLRSMAPLIRDGIVRLWVCDPKYLEFAAIKPITENRYADDAGDCLELIEAWVDDMERTQKRMQRAGLRSVQPSREYPLNLLIVDEIGSLVAYRPEYAREITALLARGTSMGRATNHVADAYIQEPDKDTLKIRDLFPNRVCLRATSPTHPDMVLGEGARERGAIADQIPAVPETAGIGYRTDERSRVPRRVRAAYTTDDNIRELVEFVRNGQTGSIRSIA